MNDTYRVPTLALLSILVTVFAVLYLRSRTTRKLLWLIGWTMAVLRLAMTCTAYGEHGVGLAISNAAIEMAALMFLGSMSPIYFRHGIRVFYVVLFAVPLILFSVLTSLVPSPGMSLRVIDIAIAIVAVLVAVHWSAQKGQLPVWFTMLFSVGAGAACVYTAFTGNYYQVLRLAHSGICLITALLVLATYRRLSPGVIFTVTGLLSWCSPILVDIFLREGDPRVLLCIRALNLMKVMTAVGMLLLVLEDELTLNESAQKRDRRARAEMEQYSKLDISAVSYRDFGIHYDRVCEVITKASRFQRAAILLRGVEQNFHLAGRAGMEAELTRALDAMGQRMTPDKLKEFARSSHIAVELGNTRMVNLRPLLQHGDDLERLGFLRAYTIPMRTGTELDGVLVLSDLKAPTESLVAEDLLPLELLVARLAAARENNRLLRRLVQSEKLAGLGQLAGGVAHELNNPLTVVMGYAELIEEGEADHATRQNAGVIRTESQRMKQTIESLARFWKSLPSELAPLSVKQMLMDIWQPRKLELEREGIELEITIAEDLPGIRANGEQMRQVFGQVLNNSVIALQTFPANHEKRIRIDAATVKDKVQVVISDTGPGFPNLNRVFDPFFTTKKPGEGPGLGLSLCYSIIREHGGEISAFNLQPHGAAVAIEMPADVAEKPVPLAGEVSVQ